MAVLACAALTLGCNGILGIESATLDLDAAAAEGGGQENDDPLTCDHYCTVLEKACTGDDLEYLPNGTSVASGQPTDVCRTLCRYIPTGTYRSPSSPTPPSEDTLGCRLWHAHAAESDPDVHCRHAGLLGALLCGGPCLPFCRIDLSYCTDDHNISVYPGNIVNGAASGCMSACEGDTDGGFPYEIDEGDLVDDAGAQIDGTNTLNCRLWHLQKAVQIDDAMLHCPHTSFPSSLCQ